MKSILVTGCNRGIGLGLVKQLLKAKKRPDIIIATCRSIEKAKDLAQIAAENKNFHLLELDVKEVNQFDQFRDKVQGIVKDVGLGVLVNNAGISSKFTRINLLKYEQMLDAFKVNTCAPIFLTKALLPALNTFVQNNDGSHGVVVNITSILGSISANADGGFYPYRCSKAALNMATKSLSVDLKKDKILVTALHPGWVKTDMGGSNAPLEIEASTASILEFILKLDESHNGGYFQYDGSTLNW